MTLSVQFSDSRQRASVRIFCVAILSAAAAFASMLYFGSEIDARRVEQLQVARVEAQSKTVLNNLDSLLLGEEIPSFDEDIHQLESSATSLETHGDLSRIRFVLNSFEKYAQAAQAERTAVETKNMAEAHRLDRESTDPTFEAFNDRLDILNRELQAEALRWIEIDQIFIGLSLFLGALTIATLIVRFRRQVESTLLLEMGQQSVEYSERRLNSLVRNSTDVIALVSPDGVVSMVSDACEIAWGIPASAILHNSIFDVMEPADRVRIKRIFAELLDKGQPRTSVEGRVLNPAGELKDFDLQVANLLEDPNVVGISLTFHDLTERKKFEQELTHHAFHDRLTTLPNRALFLDRLTHRLKAAGHQGKGFAVLFIDLDNFKVINDSLGHEAGDTLLVEVAARLQSEVLSVDTVARLGGDEFTIIIDEVAGPEEAIEVAERIQQSLLLPVSLGDREVFVGSSIGIVMSSDSAPDAAGLLRDADTAMYDSKTNGKSRITVFDRQMGLLAMDRMELESDLRLAVQEEQFFLVYQPIVDIASGKVREVEALIRWSHPERGIIAPMSFIPLAEETGLICAMGSWALREATAQLAEWNAEFEGKEPLRISVNVSGRQLQEKSFVAEVQAIIEQSGLDPNLVELEITETTMLKDLSKTKDVLAELRALGLRIAIDDFGTGYSSMAYLSHLPIDKLKIDRSFVTPLGGDARADSVVQAMITMAQALGLGITGEGIETQEQRKTLEGMGCEYGQGYLFDRPLTGDLVSQLLGRSQQLMPLAA